MKVRIQELGPRESYGQTIDYARFETEDGHLVGVSRYGGKPWCIDSLFMPNGLPVYVHGVGSRCCAKSVLTEGIAAQLDAAVAKPPTLN